VENVVAGHPKVAEVALIGVSHPRWGETPLAVIVPTDPAAPPLDAEIEAYCRERLAAYKCPRTIALVEALPRNPSGKVLKTELRNTHSSSDLVASPTV
jgi:fatty-acyl-CoA synthase/long-chain acyl-CoA synthetase